MCASTRNQSKITRRQLLGAAALAAGGIGAAGIGLYGVERWTMAPPFAQSSGLATPLAATPPAPDVPLLLISPGGPGVDFSPYLAEILRAEGLIAFRTASLAQLDVATLARFPIAILAAGAVGEAQAAMLRAFVAGGGGLVGIRPDPRLAELFGVSPLGATAIGDYLRPEPAAPEAAGLTVGPLQVHGPYDRLALAGARPVAVSAGGDPLVTIHRFGAGAAALWSFDLARVVALIRQGNPLWADQDRDAIEAVRAADMFVDWIDLDRIGVPQADEHQRLFAAVVESLLPEAPPLPRLWYLPGAAPAALVATGDAHGSRVSHVEQVLGAVERRGGTASIYYTPPPTGASGRLSRKARWAAEVAPLVGSAIQSDDPLPGPAQVAEWRMRGHEFGIHPYVEGGLEPGYNAHWNEFVKYGYGPLPPTVRTHRILWRGWVDNALVQARYGLRMNLDHYHIGSAVRRPDGAWTMGYLSGTGLPMRFVREDGALLSVYQQHTHLVDEHLMNVFDTGHEMGLSGAEAAALTIAQIAESVQRFPAALGLQCHVDPFLMGGDRAQQVGSWLEATLDYAAAQGLPILSAERWLAFTEARAATTIAGLTWERGALRFTVEAPPSPEPLTLLLPARHGAAALRELQVGGQTTPTSTRMVGDRQYAAVVIAAGTRSIAASYGS